MPHFRSATLILAVAGALTAAAPGLAADLENHDDADYEIRIHDVGTTHSSIEGNTTRISICSECTIEVVGVGEVEVDAGTDAVIIRDGAVHTE